MNSQLGRLMVVGAVDIAVVSRLMLARLVQHPGHADPSFYLTVAGNIASGRGFVIDYVWNYLSGPVSITHPSNDYWMPLTSILISLPLLVLGNSVFSALLPSILFGLILSLLAYFAAKTLSGSRLVILCSAVLVLFLPTLFNASLSTDSTIYYAVFASASLLLMIKGRDDPKFFLLSTVSAVLAYLTRQDGLLLVPTLLATILFAPHTRRTKANWSLLCLVLWLALASPWLAYNYATLGALAPPAPLQTAFLTEYEDLYTYAKPLSLQAYLDWGTPNILRSKLEMAASNARTLLDLMPGLLWLFVAVAAFEAVRRQRSRYLHSAYAPPALFLILLFGFYTLIATFPSGEGAFLRSAAAVIPFALILALETLEHRVRSKPVLFVLLALVAITLVPQSVSSTRDMIANSAALEHQMLEVNDVLRKTTESTGDQEVVVMTRNPWEMQYSTGYKAIQIPNDGLDTIYEMARRYRANYLLLPAPRQALKGLYSGTHQDERFEPMMTLDTLVLFRVRLGSD